MPIEQHDGFAQRSYFKAAFSTIAIHLPSRLNRLFAWKRSQREGTGTFAVYRNNLECTACLMSHTRMCCRVVSCLADFETLLGWRLYFYKHGPSQPWVPVTYTYSSPPVPAFGLLCHCTILQHYIEGTLALSAVSAWLLQKTDWRASHCGTTRSEVRQWKSSLSTRSPVPPSRTEWSESLG